MWNTLDTFQTSMKIYQLLLTNLSLMTRHKGGDTILFNNKEIQVDGKPIFIRDWFNKGILILKDLYEEKWSISTFKEFASPFRISFLQFYQILGENNCNPTSRGRYKATAKFGHLFLSTKIHNLTKRNWRERISIVCFVVKKHQLPHSGLERKSKDLSIDCKQWIDVFRAVNSNVCNDTKLKEFQ